MIKRCSTCGFVLHEDEDGWYVSLMVNNQEVGKDHRCMNVWRHTPVDAEG